jgi:hypothetical protein
MGEGGRGLEVEVVRAAQRAKQEARGAMANAHSQAILAGGENGGSRGQRLRPYQSRKRKLRDRLHSGTVFQTVCPAY